MPDILLIQPPIRDFYLTAKRTLPYGLACIAGALRRQGFSVAILDALATDKSRVLDRPAALDYLQPYYGRADKSPFGLFHQWRHFGYHVDHIVRQARASGAFLIGISSLFSAYSDTALETAEQIKKALPEAVVVLGGHHPTALPEAVMAHAWIDYVVRGDGEAGLPALAAALRGGGSLEKVPGLVWREDNGRIVIRPPAVAGDLEALPPPAYDLIDLSFYERRGQRSITLSATRGCPLRCTYCAVHAGTWHGYRRRSVAAVMADLDAAAAGASVGFIDFEDEHLSADREWFHQLLTALERRFAGFRPELRAMNGLYAPSLDEPTVQHMHAAGFKALNLALITTDALQLERFGRPAPGSSFDRALQLAETCGMTAVAYLIVAGPEQTPEQSVADLLYLAQRRVLAGVSVFYPSPGSRDFQWCRDQNLLPETFMQMRATALPLVHRSDRTQTVTLLRLGRLLNFSKQVLDSGRRLPHPSHAPTVVNPGLDRQALGEILLAAFLHDNKIRGADENGTVYEHVVDHELAAAFLKGMDRIKLRGVVA